MISGINYVSYMVTKYWPDCLYRPYTVALAWPRSMLRRQLIECMQLRGATEQELNAVFEHYRYLDESIDDFNNMGGSTET